MGGLYPIFADITGRQVVVIGGGQVAQRKVEVLVGCGAQVKLISPQVTQKLAQWHKKGRIKIEKRRFKGGDTAGAWLVIAASGDEKINREVFAEAQERRVFCNVVDGPEWCSFQVPSVLKRDALQIAISTGGVSPALAKRIRKELEEEFGSFYGPFLAGLKELREHIKHKYPQDQERRTAIFEAFVNSEALELLRSGKTKEFRRTLEEWKNR